MKHIAKFEGVLAETLPHTHALLVDVGLVIHDSVTRVVLHGSRGLAGHARPDSDIDLTLLVQSRYRGEEPEHKILLDSVLSTTLDHWKSPAAPDLAAVFDKSACGLRCFEVQRFDASLCEATAGCMGIYKLQKGFGGFVPAHLADCRRMYPLLTIWRAV